VLFTPVVEKDPEHTIALGQFLTASPVHGRIAGVKNEKISQKTSGPSSLLSNKSLLSALAEAGYSNTRARRAIGEVLADATESLTPLEILKRGRRKHAQLGLGTVYRTLNILVSLDLVRRVHQTDGCHAYLPASRGHHHVVICQNCGCAAEFPGGDGLQILIDQVEASTGYRVNGHLLQLFGQCPACAEKKV